MKSRTNIAFLLASVVCASPSPSQNTLAVVRSSLRTLEVRLDNKEAVGGIQFSLRSTSDVTLETVDRIGRTSGAQWMVASHRANDSTVNVVILGQTQVAFDAGSGSLVRVTFSEREGATALRATLANVMVASPKAESLAVAIIGADWTPSPAVAENSTTRRFSFGQNYPNPFNPSTRISYRLDAPAQVELSVFDMTGREVDRLVDSYQTAGMYQVEWTSTTGGVRPASGTYFARLRVGEEVAVRKMTLMK